MASSERRGVGLELVVAAVLAVGFLVWGLGGQEPAASSYGSMAPAAPSRLVIPSLDAKARVVPIRLGADGVLMPPEDAATVGWWQGSTRPGSTRGQTVITGHSLHEGDGALDSLRELEVGETVDLVTRKGRMRYAVTRTQVLGYQAVAQRARRLFGQDRRDGRLVLVSCTGFNGTAYTSNVIVFARPLGVPQG